VKKKLSLIGLALLLIFSLAGCGSKSEEKEPYDQTTLEQYADAIVMNFSSMSAEEMEQYQSMSDYSLNYTLMMVGLPIEADDFRTMIDAWNAGLKECGNFQEFGEYTMEESNTGVMLTASVTAEERSGEMQFSFNEEGNLESLTINASYSTGEILKKAGLNTILGMGTVFVVLIFISFIISLFKQIPALEAKFRKKEAAAPAPSIPQPAAAAPAAVQTDDSELIAVIAAAIAAAEGTTTDGFIVRSIRRRKSNKW